LKVVAKESLKLLIASQLERDAIQKVEGGKKDKNSCVVHFTSKQGHFTNKDIPNFSETFFRNHFFEALILSNNLVSKMQYNKRICR
jgi:hypothetical protein